ncbi:hypothetical protein [Sedimenticola sp.]|uniref:hypothetical protein n=1 Tax=Sedimenticola sp. TaxID=1940285 RepID=UPI003D0BF4AB
MAMGRHAISIRVIATLGLPLVFSACTEQPQPPKTDPIERELDIQQEVMHQTREVIRYLDEEERLRRAQLEGAEQGQPQGVAPTDTD